MNRKRPSSWLRLDLLKGGFHLALISLSTMWWYFKWQSDQDDSWRLSLPWIDKSEQRLLMFWSKSRLSLSWPEIILSLLLYHGRYWTPKLGTNDFKSWTYHKHGVWSNSHKDNLVQKHFLTIRCGIFKAQIEQVLISLCLHSCYVSDPHF